MASELHLALEKITGHDLDTIMAGLQTVEKHLGDCDHDTLIEISDTVGSLFYIDHYDRPDLQPAVEHAVDVLAAAGPDVIPYIMSTFENSDVKANVNFAAVLGKIGIPAIPPLIEFYRHSEDPYSKSYALYALGKIKDRAILAVLPDVIEALGSEHLEVRDSAIRALGKTMELVGEKDIGRHQRDTIFKRLWAGISDPHSTIRAKIVRTLTKMARRGLMDEQKTEQFRTACLRITGRDEQARRDRAFIVWKEAAEALSFLEGKTE